jgi:hypothetical protein
MLEYHRGVVYTLIFLQLVALGLCGTYFNFCIVSFVSVGFCFGHRIERGRLVYANIHTTYVMFIIMCCATSFVLQSTAVAQASRRMAFAKRPQHAGGACAFASGSGSADELVSWGGREPAAAGQCGLAAYRSVRLDKQHPLPQAGTRTMQYVDRAATVASKQCTDAGRALTCFDWCVRLEDRADAPCFRPAWSMVQNIYVANARSVYVATDPATQRAVSAWPLHTVALAGGARITSRARGALSTLATHVPGLREIDRMPEPYTDEFLVVVPLNASVRATVAVRLSQRCMSSARVCVSDHASLSSSVTRLAHSAKTAPCTILAVATKCSAPGLAGCDWDLPTILTTHILNTFVIVASMYIACLTNAHQNQASPALIIIVAPCLLCLNWVPLLVLCLARARRLSLRAVLLAVLQIAQLSVLAFELNAAHRAGLKYSETHVAVLLLAPCTALRGAVFFTSCVLSIATTAAVFIDTFDFVRLYSRD